MIKHEPLERPGDIEPDEASPREHPNHLAQIFRRYRERHVAARQSRYRKPMIIDRRHRAQMVGGLKNAGKGDRGDRHIRT